MFYDIARYSLTVPKGKVKKDSVVKAKLVLLSPLYLLTAGPMALRAFRSTAAARAIY